MTDPLAPARGCTWGLLIGVVLWLALMGTLLYLALMAAPWVDSL